MSAHTESDRFDQLSECLLQLGQLAKNHPVAEFLSEGAALALTAMGCQSAWWGLAADNKSDQGFDILQADFLGLPKSLVEDWRSISTIDPFSKEMIESLGQVKRINITESRINSQPLLTEFAMARLRCFMYGLMQSSMWGETYTTPGHPAYTEWDGNDPYYIIKCALGEVRLPPTPSTTSRATPTWARLLHGTG